VPSRNRLTLIAATFLRNHAGASQADVLRILGPEWRSKVAAIASSTHDEIRRSTETCVRTVFQRGYTFSCGLANNSGCRCNSACQLYTPLSSKKSAGEDTRTTN